MSGCRLYDRWRHAGGTAGGTASHGSIVSGRHHRLHARRANGVPERRCEWGARHGHQLLMEPKWLRDILCNLFKVTFKHVF